MLLPVGSHSVFLIWMISVSAATVSCLMAEPVPITKSLDGIMKSLRGTDRIQIGGVFGKWADAVGPNVAAHVRPVRLDQGVLTVEADDAAWATQVKFLSGKITSRLEEIAGVQVERVEVRVSRTR